MLGASYLAHGVVEQLFWSRGERRAAERAAHGVGGRLGPEVGDAERTEVVAARETNGVCRGGKADGALVGDEGGGGVDFLVGADCAVCGWRR